MLTFFGCSELDNKTKEPLAKLNEGHVGEIIYNDFHEEIIMGMIMAKIPNELHKMTKEQLEEKYAVKVRPLIAFCNKDASATFSFNSIPQEVEENKLTELLPVMGQQFERVYPKISWISKGMVEVGSKQFIEYEFTSPTAIKEVYSLVYITEIDGFLLISTFSSTIEQKNKWQPLARESMKSIQLI